MTCTIDACDQGVYLTGLCRFHYDRRQHGRLVDGPHRDDGDHFQLTVACPTDGCENYTTGPFRVVGNHTDAKFECALCGANMVVSLGWSVAPDE